ncbi:MAG: CBS domain-containing protein [Propionivibrio sp.]
MEQTPDVLCRAIMSEPPAVLKDSDPLSFALRSLVRCRMPALPVVDADGHYVGMLPRSRLIALAMPRVLSQEHGKFSLSDLLEFDFIHDSLADLQARFDAAASNPVMQHLGTGTPVLTPDTPLTNTMLFLHRERNVLPVVEDGKLVGIVTVWDVLARIGRVV